MRPEAFRIGTSDKFRVKRGPHDGHIVESHPFPTMRTPKFTCSCGSECTGYPETGDLTLKEIAFWNTNSRPQGEVVPDDCP